MEPTHLLACPRFLALLCLMCCLGATPSQSQVLWADDAQTQPRFVPEDVLSGKEASPLDQGAIAALHAAIHAGTVIYAGRLQCKAQVLGDPDPRSTISWRSLPEKVQAGELVFRAKIEDLLPGWDTRLDQTVTLVRLNVLEVFSHSDGLVPGSAVSYLQPFGEMQVDGKTTCTMARPRDYKAVVGDEIVVTARRFDAHNRELLEVDPRSALYPVHGDRVEAIGLIPPSAPTQFSLQELRHLGKKRER